MYIPQQKLSKPNMNKIKEIFIGHGVSAKGNDFFQLCIIFESGYMYRTFLNAEQKFALNMSGLAVKDL